MFVRSTGLGRTLLRGRIAKIVTTTVVPSTLEESNNGQREPKRFLMEMEIQHPVHWTVRAFMDPPDVREMVLHILKNPGLIFSGLKFILSKGPAYDTPALAEAPAAAAKAAPVPGPATLKGPAPIPVRK